MTNKEAAIEALKQVKDPEINMDIWTLGLVYNIKLKKEQGIKVTMTLTTPHCPFGPQIIADAKGRLQDSKFKEPEIEVVFEPPWKPSDEVRAMLGV